MSTPFSRSIRSLEADSYRPSAGFLALFAALFLGWITWALAARVGLYEASPEARLEVKRALHTLQSPTSARVTASYLALGSEVEKGAVLVELEAGEARLRLEEEARRREGLVSRLDGLRAELGRERGAGEHATAARGWALEEARAQLQAARTETHFADGELERSERLHEKGLLADRDLVRARVDIGRTRAEVRRWEIEGRRRQAELQLDEDERGARQARLRQTIAHHEGELATSEVTLKRLAYRLEQRVVRAPASGQLGEVTHLEAGAFVSQGDRLCVVIGRDQLKAVAEFRPGQVVGRIHRGQPARLRLDGFPSIHYGSLEATVERVGSEPRQGRVRVELALRRAPSSPIPLHHGLPGSVEVEVARVSPLRLLLLSVGATPRP